LSRLVTETSRRGGSSVDSSIWTQVPLTRDGNAATDGVNPSDVMKG
jgi:hypothetical protein